MVALAIAKGLLDSCECHDSKSEPLDSVGFHVFKYQSLTVHNLNSSNLEIIF